MKRFYFFTAAFLASCGLLIVASKISYAATSTYEWAAVPVSATSSSRNANPAGAVLSGVGADHAWILQPTPIATATVQFYDQGGAQGTFLATGSSTPYNASYTYVEYERSAGGSPCISPGCPSNLNWDQSVGGGYLINGLNFATDASGYPILSLFVGHSITTTTIPTISFITPAPNSTIGTFFYWELGTTNVQTSTVSIVIIASQWNGTSTLDFSDPHDDGAIYEDASTTQQIPAHLTPSAAQTSTYYAMAGLFHSGSSTPYAQTGIISFTLDLEATSTQNPNGTIQLGGTQPIPTTANCEYTSSTFFGDPVGNIREGICAALTFLFIPNTAEQNDLSQKFQNIQTPISRKPPFGYFQSASDALSGISSSTATTTLLNATSSAELATVTAPLDAGVAAVIGFMTITWLFHRARHFEPT
ncbi:MAG: hypothetical protein ACRENK_11840 [Gemmatimonadaceae bacterium]